MAIIQVFDRPAMVQVVVKMIEHGAGLLGKEQNRGKLARTEVCKHVWSSPRLNKCKHRVCACLSMAKAGARACVLLKKMHGCGLCDSAEEDTCLKKKMHGCGLRFSGEEDACRACRLEACMLAISDNRQGSCAAV
eukprot:1157548-Pelagomonas_calceolata.AAC.8